MAYPPTLADLRSDVLSRLAEPVNSPAGQLDPGTSDTPTITTAATITQYLNEAQEDLARSCYPVVDYGTLASTPTGTQALSFSSLTVTSGKKIWAARGVSWNGVALSHCSRSALDVWFPTWITDANGTPAYWYEQGEDGIGLYPKPSAAQSTVVNGLAVPVRLSADGDIPTWLPADRTPLLVYYAASMIAAKNTQNPSLAPRAPLWRQEYEAGKAELLARLVASDPKLAQAHFGVGVGGK
jgi:hypothetical protein